MKKILVVDDEHSMRVTIKALLEKAGYQVDIAADASCAYKLFVQNMYDVVLTDIIMPRVTGMELLSEIRKLSKTVQVIAMTGEPNVDTAVLAVKNGANDYLSKPIDKQSLLVAINHAVKIKTLHDEKEILERERKQYLKELEFKVESRTQELQKTLQSIVLLLSSVVEVKDPYTAGHQRRVGNLAAAIAKRMGCSMAMVNNVRIAGYLHDIGKIAIPAETLNKPGRINAMEMGLIKTHSQQGYEILRNAKLPSNVAEIIYQHHERLDGSGYPRGLVGNSILEEANIISVADVVEAMMSNRPYRAALGIEAALAEIMSKKGEIYNPQVVLTCIDLIEKDGYLPDDNEHSVVFAI